MSYNNNFTLSNSNMSEDIPKKSATLTLYENNQRASKLLSMFNDKWTRTNRSSSPIPNENPKWKPQQQLEVLNTYYSIWGWRKHDLNNAYNLQSLLSTASKDWHMWGGKLFSTSSTSPCPLLAFVPQLLKRVLSFRFNSTLLLRSIWGLFGGFFLIRVWTVWYFTLIGRFRNYVYHLVHVQFQISF